MGSTDLYGASINIFDPFFGSTTSDAQTARQMALIILGTAPGSLDGFPDAGFLFDEQLLRALDATALAMLPQEVVQGILSEPAFTDATATPTTTQTPGGGVAMALDMRITGASGDTVGFTLASGG